MASEGHEMESVSSFGKDDDPDFVPTPITRNKRTESWFQGGINRIVSRGVASAPDPEALRDATRFEEVKKQLCQSLSGTTAISGHRTRCRQWYLEYIDFRIAQIWTAIIARLVLGSTINSPAASVKTRILVYEMLVLVANSLQEKSLQDGEDCSLLSIVHRLRKQKFIKDDSEPLAIQMVFQFVAWLTALYAPLPDASTSHLAIVKNAIAVRQRRRLRNPVLRSSLVEINAGYQPIHRLLNRFGSVLPEVQPVIRPEASGGLEAGAEWITATYVSFHSLQQVLNVEIEWVDTLNQHLDFDQRNNILRVFRLPSICRLMYRDEEGTLLTRLYVENEREAGGYNQQHSGLHPSKADFEDFLVEILLSYRLIFGRYSRSRSKISRLLDSKKESWRREGCYDPLLEILCTKDRHAPEIQEIHRDLQAREFENYISLDEFPFLGRRLIDLQRFSMGQNPHSLRRLWNDRRSFNAWFAIWAVVVFGGGTLIVQIFQLVFQIWQPTN